MDTTLLRLLLCRSPLVLLLTLATALPMLGGCETPARVAEPAARTPQDAIRRVLNADARLGNVRNDASRSRSVSEAALAYAGALGSLDYSGTPASFRAAFLDHARAWRSFGQTLRGYPEVDIFRTEMHDAIERMKATNIDAAVVIDEELADVWATWEIVAQIARENGVDVE